MGGCLVIRRGEGWVDTLVAMPFRIFKLKTLMVSSFTL